LDYFAGKGILIMARQRIQKILSESGVASRRAVEEMILEGRITVNGELVASLPCFIGPGDEVLVDNMPVRKRPSNKRYYLLNKPKHVVCTQDDPQGRKRAVDLLPRMKERLFCVGRLDADSTGIIILTNDGELTQRLTHPSYEVSKTYQVEIAGELSPGDVEKFKRGIWMDGKRTMPAQLRVVRKTRDRSVIQVTLREGRNREIRRMLARLGHKVYKLGRVAIGPITDRGLKLGSCRELTPEEIELLGKSCQVPQSRKKTASGSRKRRKPTEQTQRRQPAGKRPKRDTRDEETLAVPSKRQDDEFMLNDDILDEPMVTLESLGKARDEEPRPPKRRGQSAEKRRPQQNRGQRGKAKSGGRSSERSGGRAGGRGKAPGRPQGGSRRGGGKRNSNSSTGRRRRSR
jgi:23S rRNA pseudouridine2605 synthase